MSATPRRLPLLNLVGTLVVALAFAWIGWGLWRQWGAISQHRWQVNLPLLALSLLAAAGWFLLRARLWQQVLAAFGCRLGYGAAFHTWAVSEIGRYLPGKVWYAAGRAYLCRECGIPMGRALMSMAVELALLVVAAVPFLALRLVIPAAGWPGAVLAAVVSLALLVSPLAVMRLAARIVAMLRARITPEGALAAYRWFRQGGMGPAAGEPPHPSPPSASLGTSLPGGEGEGPAQMADRFPRAYLGMVGTVLAAWGLLGIGFLLFTVAVAGTPGKGWLALALSYPAALVAGMAAVVTPSGLGVREGVLAALITGPLPSSLALPVALLSRIWITAAELVCAAVALRVGKR